MKWHLGKRNFCTRGVIIIVMATLSLLAGCQDYALETVREEEERAYQRGKEVLREGDYRQALEAFLKVIANRPSAPESHLEAGEIYLTYLKDPISAIYHYNQYLTQKPQGEQHDLVKGRIETARKEFARTLPGQPFQSEVERFDLMELVDRLKGENLQLQRQVAQLQEELRHAQTLAANNAGVRVTPQGTSNPTSGQQPPPQERPVAGHRTYTVKPGDTLSRISTNVYGSAARWIDIYNANRDQLPNQNSLRVGQELRIPQ